MTSLSIFYATREGQTQRIAEHVASEAGAERSDATPAEHARFVADVHKVLERFFAETGWHPQRVQPVAGALLYTHYNFLIRLVMQHIAKHAGGSTDTSRDHEYTDWVALDQFVAAVAEEFAPSATEMGSLPGHPQPDRCRPTSCGGT